MHLDSISMPDHARVWLYTSERKLTAEETRFLHENMKAFTDRWTAHGAKMTAHHVFLHDCVLVLVADEQRAAASGCSIDDSVRTIKAIGEGLKVDFFNRHRVVYQKETGEWENKSASEFWALRKANVVTAQTKLVNPLCNSWGEFVREGVVEFENSWHQQMWEH